MSTALAASMQAALYVREKQKQRRKRIRRGRLELPSNVATKDIAPFPRYPPASWARPLGPRRADQGKAAWQDRDRERRTSVTEAAVSHRLKASEAHRRWMKRNRIHDSSFGGSSSDDEEIPGGVYGHQSAAANALLYVGLGTVAIGLVISFVGTGEKGFKTLELRLIGPSLIGGGLLCCLIRTFLCICPSRCLRRRHKHRHRHKERPLSNHQHQGFFEPAGTNKDPAAAEDIPLTDHTTSLLPTTKKTVSIVPTPSSSVVATTSLFLQHEQESASKSNYSQLPSVNIPNFISSTSDEEDVVQKQNSREGVLLEIDVQNADKKSFDISSFSSSNSHERHVVTFAEQDEKQVSNSQAKHSDTYKRDKLTKSRTPVHSKDSAITSPSATGASQMGLVNPDPEAHRVEEDILSWANASKTSQDLSNIQHGSTVKLTAASPKHSEKSDLLQNEIVLSPSKLQQDM